VGQDADTLSPLEQGGGGGGGADTGTIAVLGGPAGAGLPPPPPGMQQTSAVVAEQKYAELAPPVKAVSVSHVWALSHFPLWALHKSGLQHTSGDVHPVRPVVSSVNLGVMTQPATLRQTAGAPG